MHVCSAGFSPLCVGCCQSSPLSVPALILLKSRSVPAVPCTQPMSGAGASGGVGRCLLPICMHAYKAPSGQSFVLLLLQQQSARRACMLFGLLCACAPSIIKGQAQHPRLLQGTLSLSLLLHPCLFVCSRNTTTSCLRAGTDRRLCIAPRVRGSAVCRHSW